MSTLDTTDAVIEVLGGTVAVANLTGKAKSAVSMWKARGRFPCDTFLILTHALRGIKGDDGKAIAVPSSLWGIREPDRKRTPSLVVASHD